MGSGAALCHGMKTKACIQELNMASGQDQKCSMSSGAPAQKLPALPSTMQTVTNHKSLQYVRQHSDSLPDHLLYCEQQS